MLSSFLAVRPATTAMKKPAARSVKTGMVSLPWWYRLLLWLLYASVVPAREATMQGRIIMETKTAATIRSCMGGFSFLWERLCWPSRQIEHLVLGQFGTSIESCFWGSLVVGAGARLR